MVFSSVYPYFFSEPIYYRTVFPTTPGLRATLSRLGEGKGLLSFSGLKIRGIATPVCALVRNDRVQIF